MPGDLDPGFGGGDGRVTTDFGDVDRADGVAVQADGKIVVAGSAEGTGGPDFAVARYNTDGSLDPTFDGDGKVTTDFASNHDQGFAVALQADGKIVVAGEAFLADLDFGLARYNTDGSLDTTFDGDGKLTTDFGVSDSAAAVALQGDGKIVAAGNVLIGSYFDFGLARYNTNGSLDPTFDGDGRLTTDFGDTDSVRGVAIQADGKIVAAGATLGDFALARYNTNGSLDTTFGDGRVTTDFGGLDTARGIAIRGDRRLVAVGCTSCSDASDFAVARYKICRTSSRRSSIPC